MKALKQLFAFFFLVVAALGFVYFGPREYTKILTDNLVFKVYLKPLFDRLEVLSGTQSEIVGLLIKSKGDIQFRPDTELLYKNASTGQKFSRRTLVSSAGKSSAIIRLIDDSMLRLDENSVVLIDLKPQMGSNNSTLTLKVVQGAMVARKAATSKMAVKVLTTKGVERELTEEKLQIVAPRKIRNSSMVADGQVSDLSLETEEYIGEPVQDTQALVQELEAKKQTEIAQQEVERAAAEKLLAQPPSNLERVPATVASSQELATPEKEAESLVPDRIIPRVVRESQLRWKAPPIENHLTRAIYAKKLGKDSEARRYVALATSNPGFFEDTFNDATRIAAEGLLDAYVAESKCQVVNDTLGNIQRRYAHDAAAREWASGWRLKAEKSGCSLR